MPDDSLTSAHPSSLSHPLSHAYTGESGSPILLIHGFGASVGHFRHQMNMFPSLGHRVFAIDLLGKYLL